MVDQVLHHAQALPQVFLHLEVHEDGADKANAKDGNVQRQADMEILLHAHHDSCDDQERDLQTGDENGIREGFHDIFLDKHQLLSRVPVQRLKSHRVGITLVQVQLFIRLFDLF